MTTRAYDEIYLSSAQNILGHAVDYAVNTLGISPKLFENCFTVSNVSKQFETGNPTYVTGMNGCELARRALSESGLNYEDSEDVMYLDKSPEYWAGWALTHLQWHSACSFGEIFSVFPLEDIIKAYPVYHEMDITNFTDDKEKQLRDSLTMTRLKYYRNNCGFSQSALSAASGVPLRQIQLFEQRQRDINKAAAETLLMLSRPLLCNIEDLLE
jgi:DNA-binding transcriptional regulator YiaG